MFSFSSKSQNTEILLQLTVPLLSLKYNALLKHASQYTEPEEVWRSVLTIGSSVAQTHGLSEYIEGRVALSEQIPFDLLMYALFVYAFLNLLFLYQVSRWSGFWASTSPSQFLPTPLTR